MNRALPLALVLFVTGCPEEPEAPWKVVFDGLPAPLLSIAGTGPDDVWAAGFDDGKGPLVLHFDGRAWKRHATGAAGGLWWVHPFKGGPVFFGGDGGLILRYENGRFERMQTPGGLTVWGIWGATPNDLWAVGGGEGGLKRGFAWRYDGTAWTEVTLPDRLDEQIAMYKVWGRGPKDVWLVGARGYALHWDGSKFTDTSAEFHGSERPLFTAHGTGERLAAVGGFASGTILERNGAKWSSVAPKGIFGLSGVFLHGEHEGWAVGQRLTILKRDETGWTRDPVALGLLRDLHAVWFDGTSGVWAVGAADLTDANSGGVILLKGREVPGGTFTE